ncbi:MAG: aconitate hydratase AcnA [Leptospirales bacterium]
MNISKDSLKVKTSLKRSNMYYTYYSLEKAALVYPELKRLPKTLKVLAENLLRFEDGKTVFPEDIVALSDWVKNRGHVQHEISFRPARVLMQDFTGVPALVDFAAMRSAMSVLGKNPDLINPEIPADLVIDHSVSVDFYATSDALSKNVELEYQRNQERYELLSWGQKSFQNFHVVPPGTGICHQVNLEYLGKTVWTQKTDGEMILMPDTLIGTDSHTTMINGLAVLGWGVGGIEAEAAMLGQPISLSIPEVIGFKFTGKLKEGITATDLVLTVTSILRKKGVVGKFVEFFGSGLSELSLEDRATISNMAPEYGATCGYFPADVETLKYLDATGRTKDEIELVEVYSKLQGLWRSDTDPDPVFTDIVELNLSEVEPSIAGPKRPQDRIVLSQAAESFQLAFPKKITSAKKAEVVLNGENVIVEDGDVLIAAITSCTNTSNPSVIIAAGLLAQNAVNRGLKVGPKVKTSLAPGSQVVAEYLENAGLQKFLNELGFYIAGFGCTTCIGNSGPLAEPLSRAIQENNLAVASVLSGNRNFEGRIHSQIKASYLASPPLVVAYALAGSLKIDITKDALGKDKDGNPVYLSDIWPKKEDITKVIRNVIHKDLFKNKYSSVFQGDEKWQKISSGESKTYGWNNSSTYIQEPPYFINMNMKPSPVESIKNGGILGIFGDSVTTDHISPAGSIPKDGAAGRYLIDHKIQPVDFNSFGSRRGNHEVMIRGTFANIRIQNEMVDKTGGYTIHYPSKENMSIYDAAMKYAKEKRPLVVFAGKEYGTGSSRDWAAKGTKLLGVKAVIAESFERIHRSNLLGMGVLPLCFASGITRKDLCLKGNEQVNIELSNAMKPGAILSLEIKYENGVTKKIDVQSRIDTAMELEYFLHDGILPYAFRQIVTQAL